MAADRDDGQPPETERLRDTEAAAGRSPDRPENKATELEPSSSDRPAAGPELRQEQLAEHARYRQVVEASDRAEAARRAWAAAAPELAQQWNEHKRRHPRPEREEASTQLDGSWNGDGGRRLSPEQNAEASKYAADLRDEAEQTIRPALERVAAADPERKLAGLEHMCKGEDRLKEKIVDRLTARPELTTGQAASLVPDAVRFTLCYPAERYADGITTDISRLKSEGFELLKLKNLWQSDQYKGVNSQWRAPDTGTRIELQFHTPEGLEAKELTHEAYERLRAEEALPAEKRDFASEGKLADFQRRVNGLLVSPPGTEMIEDFPKERSGG